VALFSALAVLLASLLGAPHGGAYGPGQPGIPICSTDGTLRYLLPDGTLTRPAPKPAERAHVCPDGVLCLAGCAVACCGGVIGKAAFLDQDRPALPLRDVRAESTAPPWRLADRHPPGQAPPLLPT
jgi:hypothetical protein